MKQLIISKKGIDSPQAIIYVLFVMLLTVCGFYLAYMYMSGLNMEIEFSGYVARYNAAAARLTNSPLCFAYEDTYMMPANEKKYQVFGGIIDWGKFTSSAVIPEKCIRGESGIWLKLEYIYVSKSHTIWNTRYKTEVVETELESRIAESSPGYAPRGRNIVEVAIETEPTEEELEKWQPKANRYYVTIKDDSGFHPGILTMRLEK